MQRELRHDGPRCCRRAGNAGATELGTEGRRTRTDLLRRWHMDGSGAGRSPSYRSLSQTCVGKSTGWLRAGLASPRERLDMVEGRVTGWGGRASTTMRGCG